MRADPKPVRSSNDDTGFPERSRGS